MTTVSARLPICDFAFSRPFPAIVHPKPEVGSREDATRDHVVDSRRQRHRVPFFLSQLIDTNRFLELETMPRFLRNAKSEHNRRTSLYGHFGRCGRCPGPAAE